MKKIVILSFYSGLLDRGVETWALNLKRNLSPDFEIEILDGKSFSKNKSAYSSRWLTKFFLLTSHIRRNFKHIKNADIVIPTNGSVQTFLCRIITLIYGKPMVVFGHAGMGADDKWNLLCAPNVFVAFSNFQSNWA